MNPVRYPPCRRLASPAALALVLAWSVGCTVQPAPAYPAPAPQPVAQRAPAQTGHAQPAPRPDYTEPAPAPQPDYAEPEPEPDYPPAPPEYLEPEPDAYPEPERYSQPEVVPEPPEVYREPAPRRRRARRGLRKSGPIVCGGAERLRLVKVHILARGTGLAIRGSCHVVLVDSRIDAGGVGVRIGGSGTLTVRRSRIRGNRAAAQIGGSATLAARKSLFAGKFLRGGAARFRDLGDNRWRGGQPPAAEPPARPRPLPPPPARPRPLPAPEPAPELRDRGPLSCRGKQRLRLEKVHVKSRGDGVTARGNCEIILVDSVVEAGGFGLRVVGNARIAIRRTRVNGRRGSALLRDRSRLDAKDSVLIGTFDRADKARFIDEGGNTVNGGVVGPAPAPGPAPGPVAEPRPRHRLKASGPISCQGQQKLRLDKVRIDTKGVAVLVRGQCDLVIADSHILGGASAIKITGKGRVTIKRSFVSGRNHSVVLDGLGALITGQTRFVGSIDRGKQTVFRDLGDNTFR